jgi:hypothetical protein
MEIDTSSAKFKDMSRQVSPASLLHASAGNYQTAVVDESEMIRTQMGKQNRSEMVAEHETPCTIPPRNTNSNTWTTGKRMGVMFTLSVRHLGMRYGPGGSGQSRRQLCHGTAFSKLSLLYSRHTQL